MLPVAAGLDVVNKEKEAVVTPLSLVPEAHHIAVTILGRSLLPAPRSPLLLTLSLLTHRHQHGLSRPLLVSRVVDVLPVHHPSSSVVRHRPFLLPPSKSSSTLLHLLPQGDNTMRVYDAQRVFPTIASFLLPPSPYDLQCPTCDLHNTRERFKQDGTNDLR
ncbi:hypothetical protein BDN70DRAFT_938372 [Pholiota conissans]|uniref:Uncharacterized protein n=1 Tax=Pholiota conissans TaxID=109636 RepID=A0A9P5YN22_9AGAR|nr:hypothetical protein BDN70DRAFT_938372 [Pholiota conissans]